MNKSIYLAFFLVCALLFGCSQPLSEVEKELAKPYQAVRIDALPIWNTDVTDWRYDADDNSIVFGEWYIREAKTRKLFRLSSLSEGEWMKNFDQLSEWIASAAPDNTSKYDLFEDGLFPEALVSVTDYNPVEGASIKLMLTFNTSLELAGDTLSILASASTR